MPMPDGRIGHAEVTYNGHTVMLASAFEELGFLSPRSLAGIHSQIHVRVDDVEAHYSAQAAARSPRRQGSARYGQLSGDGSRGTSLDLLVAPQRGIRLQTKGHFRHRHYIDHLKQQAFHREL